MAKSRAWFRAAIRSAVVVVLGALAASVQHVGHAAPTTQLPPEGDGKLPRLSGLLWQRLGYNPLMREKAVTFSLSGRSGSGNDGLVEVFLLVHQGDVGLELHARTEPGQLMPDLAALPGGALVKASLSRSPVPVLWWTETRDDRLLFKSWTKPTPRVTLGTRAWWHVAPAGNQPGKVLELADRLVQQVRGGSDVDLVFGRWAEVAAQAGLRDVECAVATNLIEPGYRLFVTWRPEKYPGPRLRSHTAVNAPGKKPGTFSVSTTNERTGSSSETFLMPYGITVAGPPRGDQTTWKLMKEILGVVFYRSPE